MAYERLRATLTKGNLWLYILAALEKGSSSPVELKKAVERKHGFSPATITFYSVLYKMRREGLVKRSSEAYRSAYSITDKGLAELARGRSLLNEVSRSLAA